MAIPFYSTVISFHVQLLLYSRETNYYNIVATEALVVVIGKDCCIRLGLNQQSEEREPDSQSSSIVLPQQKGSKVMMDCEMST